MDDIPGAMERPSACTIAVRDTGGSVSLEIPSRPLGLIWLVFAGNCAVLTLYVTGGICYIFFHFPLISGLWPHPPHPGQPGYLRWALEVSAGGLAGMVALLYGWSLIWIPLMTREAIMFTRAGVTAEKIGPLRRERFASDWLNVAEIVLTRDKEQLRQGKLVITLLSGKECQIGENAAEADREWLASVCQVLAERFG